MFMQTTVVGLMLFARFEHGEEHKRQTHKSYFLANQHHLPKLGDVPLAGSAKLNN